MAVIIEQRNEQVTDFSDLAQAWRRAGNITLSHDTTRGIFERFNGSSAAYSFPPPASNGAGFIETGVSATFELVVDMATDSAHTSSNTQWVGVSLRRNDGACQWLFSNHGANTLVSVLDTGSGPTFENAMTLPASVSHRWDMHVRWDPDDEIVFCRVRPYESRDDLGAWFDAFFATTSLTAAPDYVGISMCAPSGVTDPELYVYSLRLIEPDRPARNWYALADVPGNRGSVELLLNRKNRASAAAHWSRDDYAIADSTKTWTNSTPLRGLDAEFSTNELVRYRAALESVTGLELDHAWFGVPRCAASDQFLYTELGPTIVTATDVSGVFGTSAMAFTATNDHSFAAFDNDVAEIPDDESWLAMLVVSATVVPAANRPICGKQDLFQIAPVPRNGWQIWLNTGDVMLDLSDTAGGIQSVTAAKVYTAGTFFAICARVNRTAGLAQIAHSTATSGTISVAGLSYLCPLRPLRIGDSRINRADTAPSSRVHLAAFARGTQVEPVNLQTLAANILAAAT